MTDIKFGFDQPDRWRRARSNPINGLDIGGKRRAAGVSLRGLKFAGGSAALMLPENPSVEQLSQVIVQVTAPSFLLGAVAAFISVLISRMNRIIDRTQELNCISDEDHARASLKKDMPRLKRRVQLLNKAVLFATATAIVTCLLVIVAFISAFLQLQHEYGVAVLFIVALGCFTVSLANLARETVIGLSEHDHYK